MRTAHLLAFATLALPATAQTEEPSTAAQTSTEASTEGADVAQPDGEPQSIVDFFESELGFTFQREGTGQLGSRATIAVPQGYLFTDGDNTRKVLEATQNIPGGRELGLFAPADFSWWVVFDFDESGYVSDEEKDDLDADAMLESLQENAKLGNEERRRRGLPEHEIDGWAVPPQYNEQTNNLEWAFRIKSNDGSVSVNHNTRLLGRKGVMEVTLVCGPDDLQKVLPTFRERLDEFAYASGERYSEYVSGDKVAALGLTALVAGGAGVIAAKTGLLSKLWKPIAIGLIAIGAFVKKIFGFGKKEESSSSGSSSS
ncbi:MAG: DUF2167 domain-containing protein [Planctomycetes bacterium]|nr:DUF2167 domain-containing protein [Planctomycetota bacterium]